MDRLDRKRIKQDEFVAGTQHALEGVFTNPRPYLIGAGAVLLVILGVAGYRSWSESRNERAAVLFGQGQAALLADVSATEPARPDDPYRPLYKTPADRARAAAERLARAADAGGAASGPARYLRGLALLETGDLTGAVAELERAVSVMGSDPTLGPAAKAALAQACQRAGKTERAAELWQALAQKDSGFPRDLGLEGLGQAQEALKKNDDARKTYQEIVDLYPTSPALQAAKDALARLGK